VISITSITCRYYLIRLVEYRAEREARYTAKPTQRISKYEIRNQDNSYQDSAREQGVPRRAQLLAEAYPNLKNSSRNRGLGKEYKRELKSLKNRLNCGRNWHLFEQEFSSGILALVPSGEIYGIQNSE
jgi:hypothetical protein